VALSLKDASRQVGREDNYFSITKHMAPMRFELYHKLGEGDIVKGYKKYEQLSDEYLRKLEEMFFFLKEHRVKAKFGKYLVDLGLYKHPLCMDSVFNATLFRVREHPLMGLPLFNKMERIIKAYEEFCKTETKLQS